MAGGPPGTCLRLPVRCTQTGAVTHRQVWGPHKTRYRKAKQTLAINTTKRWSKRGDGNQRLPNEAYRLGRRRAGDDYQLNPVGQETFVAFITLIAFVEFIAS